jgi:hypothetical protein
MMESPDRDDEYVTLLRDRLPSAADKQRMRQRLLALGVGGGAALVPAAAKAQSLASKASLTKLLVATCGAAVLGGALYVGLTMPSREQKKALQERVAPATAPEPSVEAKVLAREREHVEPTARESANHDQAQVPAVEKRKARSPAPSHIASDTLSRENALLGAAVRALHAGQIERAERLIAEHERRFPNGILRHERERARARLKQLKDTTP